MTVPQEPYPSDDQTTNRPIPVGGDVTRPTVPRPIPTGGQSSAGANRPIPAGQSTGRPVPLTGKVRSTPIPVKKTDSSPQMIQETDEDDEEEEDLNDELQDVIKKTPPWLISAAFHMVLVIILAMIGLANLLPDDPTIELSDSEPIPELYAEELGEQQEFDNKNPTDEQNEEEVVSDSELPEVEDPLATPPELNEDVEDPTEQSVDANAAPDIGMALDGRERGRKSSLLAAYGGNKLTEASVIAALRWLKRKQGKSGTWSLRGDFPDKGDEDNQFGATAMALLAFQGAGYTHQERRATEREKTQKRDPNEFLETVQRGWAALLKKQGKDGRFYDDTVYHARLYSHAQCTIALCELYGMTKDPKLKDPAIRAVKFCVESQQPIKNSRSNPGGGWRYQPRQDSDLSVTGWFVMALQSAKMAKLDVPKKTLDNIRHYLDLNAEKDNKGGTRYRYLQQRYTPAMTAEGLLCRQYLGWNRNNPELLEATNYLLENPIDYNRLQPNVYYWYYATQVAHHMGGRPWNKWNRVMKQALPTQQIKEFDKNGKLNPERGSWSPQARSSDPKTKYPGSSQHDEFSIIGGRLYVTCLSTYMLEVYYRHLPIYKHQLSHGK